MRPRTRIWLALLAAAVGALPNVFAAPDDRSIALGLPIIVLSLAYLLTRLESHRRPLAVDLVCATLLAAPALACHTWLGLRSTDAVHWYVPEIRGMGALETAAAGGSTVGLLWGGGLALLAMRGRRGLPVAAAMLAGGAWLGAGSLALNQLSDAVDRIPSRATVHGAAVLVQWQLGALFGGLVAGGAAFRCRRSITEQLVSAISGALVTGFCTVPVVTTARVLDLKPFQTPLPQTPPGPRGVGVVYDAPNGHSASSLIAALEREGHTIDTEIWYALPSRDLPWHRTLRLGLVVAVPPDTSRAHLDEIARIGRRYSAFRLGLPGRAPGLPPGVMDTLLGWPTVGLLLDLPPKDAVWGTLRADGTIRWDASPPPLERPGACALRAEADVSVGTITTAIHALERYSRTTRCRGIAWPPPRCHPGGTGDARCPQVPEAHDSPFETVTRPSQGIW